MFICLFHFYQFHVKDECRKWWDELRVRHICTMGTGMESQPPVTDPNWVEKHPNWNKALLIPVSEISIASSGSTTGTTSIGLTNEMGLTTTRMKRGTPTDPIKLRVIYGNFNK